MSNLHLNRIQLGTDRVLMVPSPEDGTVELRKGTAEVPGGLIARFTTGANLELGASGQAIGSAAFLDALGTVSQSGGVPTGAIIERGSNANGEYVRWADGTQMCLSSPIQGYANMATGAIFQDPSPRTWAYPAVFVGNVWAAARDNTTIRWVNVYSLGTTSCLVTRYSAISNNDPVAATVIAIGRWYV